MYRFEMKQTEKLVEWRRHNPGAQALVLALHPLSQNIANEHTTIIAMSDNPQEYARSLYAVLHNADAAGAGVIWAEMPPEEPRWAAVRDRLMRASIDVSILYE
jgi:L-threonylcarbamoyladenylate synthase